MNKKHTTFIHWDGAEEKLHINLNLAQKETISAEIFDAHGKCIDHMIKKICNAGEHKFVKKLKNMEYGFYTVKLHTVDTGFNVIRFSVN